MTHILVVGAGSIGQRHIKNLVELGIHVVAFDVDDKRAEHAQSLGTAENWVDSASGSLENHLRFANDYDAAVVAVPTYLHSEVAIQLLQASIKTLFIEKPVGHNLHAASTIGSVARLELTESVVIGYSLRFHPALQIIKELLPQIGTPLYARAEVGQYLPNWHPTEDYRNWYMAHEDKGGGALLDLSHEIDYMMYLLGSYIYSVRGHVDTVSDLEIDSDDIADIQVELGNMRTLCSIHMDLLDRSYNRRLRIVGTEGTVNWDYQNRDLRLLGQGQDGIVYIYNTDRNIQFIEEMKAFIHLVETGEMDERFCPLEDGLRVMEVVDTLKRQNWRV